LDDGSCVYGGTNDSSEDAIPIVIGEMGNCTLIEGQDAGLAENAAPIGGGSEPELWYSFVSNSPGVRVEVATNEFDATIELLTAEMDVLYIQNQAAGFKGEALSLGNLTQGVTYYIHVAPSSEISSSATFSICVQTMNDSRCDCGAGPHDLCDVFLADWVQANDYEFVMVSQVDGQTHIYMSSGYGTYAPQFRAFSPRPDYGEDYLMQINAIYYVTDGNGSPQTLTVEGDELCPVILADHTLMKVRDQDNCVNHGPLYLGSYISYSPYVCGAIDYEFEFTRTDVAELTFGHQRGASNTFLRLSDVPGIVAGATYDERVRLLFDGGPGNY
jgi:hypothetical protein